MTMHSPHLVALSEATLLRALTSERRRPNLLVVCNEVTVDAALRHLVTFCDPPYHVVTLPGPLDLPEDKNGTLLLMDVPRLSLEQQVALYDWLSTGTEDLQVVSISSRPVAPLIERGQFLEALFYRLNVIYLDATPTTCQEYSSN